MEKLRLLELTLHGNLVGYLAGFQNGRNVLLFDDSFRNDTNRSTLSVITRPDFPKSDQLLAQDWIKNHKLHPVLSNLLPEGSLRELIAQGLKAHVDHEFKLLSALGHDLPGALIARPISADQVPTSIKQRLRLSSNQPFEIANEELVQHDKFSLAGVQIKFSMRENSGRFTLGFNSGSKPELGDWIIKTPSAKHPNVPLNEYTAMKLAEAVGIEIPEVRLVEMSKLDNLLPVNLPDEQFAYAIKRFDREEIQTLKSESQKSELKRVHMEDFAQVLVKYPYQKYDSANYEQIGRVIHQFSSEPNADLQQFARRLLVNILLANGDAHLKNWSLIYRDQRNPRLSPAYDILTTSLYITDERQFSLNLAKNKDWYQVNLEHFKFWSEQVDVPWRVIKPHLIDTIEKARDVWPDLLKQLPATDAHKVKLNEHWQLLHADFRI